MKKTGGRAAVIARLTLAFSALMAPFATASSQPFGLDPEASEPVLIEFRAEPGRGEFVGRAEGVVDAAGKRYYLKGLNVMAPLVLQVLAKDPARPVEVSLHRLLWEKDEWRGHTDADGNWGYVGRIYDDVGIELTASETAGFYILVWQGPAIKQQFGLTALAPAIDRASTPATDATGGRGLLVYVALAIAILALAAAFFFRRTRAEVTGIAALGVSGLLLALSAAPDEAAAQVPVVEESGFDVRLLNAEVRLDELQNALSKVVDDIQTTSQLADSIFEDVTRNYTEIIQLGRQQEQFAAEAQRQIDALRAEMQQKDRLHERLIMDLWTLVEEDREAEPDPTMGGATLDSTCGAGTEEEIRKCGECFADVHLRLKARLGYMETARILYDTSRSMTQNAIAIGDAGSGWHQLEQAQWYEEKRKILQTRRATQASYDEFLTRAYPDLRLILQKFGDCEREAGGDEDWFNREGKLFYTILKARYDRND